MLNKIRLALVLMLVLLFAGAGLAAITPVQPQNGDGSTDKPYEITSAAELYWLAERVNNGKCASTTTGRNCSAKLMKDIVINEHVLTDEGGASKVDADGNYIGEKPKNVWLPIGNDNVDFKGTFDGNGHTVSGLYVIYEGDDNHEYTGFFGRITTNAVVQNVGVVDSYIKGYCNVGGVVGESSQATIHNVYNKGYVVGSGEDVEDVGGVVGRNFYGSVDDAYNTGVVIATGDGVEEVGGVVGSNFSGYVHDVYNTGVVIATGDDVEEVGGVVGDNTGNVHDVYNTGNVLGTGKYVNDVGGVVGDNTGNFYKAYNTGFVNGAGVNVGGVIGRNAADDVVSEVYNTGDVSGYNCVGGVVGISWNSINIAYNTGAVSGRNSVGGVAGALSFASEGGGKASDVYNVGAVTGGLNVGGIAGQYTGGSLENAYNSGSVRAGVDVDAQDNYYAGNLVGYAMGASVSYSYYNTDVVCENCSGAVVAYPHSIKVTTVTEVSGKTSEELAYLDVAKAFPSSDAWKASEKKLYNTWIRDASKNIEDYCSVYELPGLVAFDIYPQVIATYLISSAAQLKLFAERVNSGETKINGKLTRNIVLNENVLEGGALNETLVSQFSQWMPIGTNANPFLGTFDGDGYTISGLYFNDDKKDSVGLFGVVGADGGAKGVVKNVGLLDSYVKGHDYVGSVVGYNLFGNVSDVFDAGFVSGNGYVGGLVGYSGGVVSAVYHSGNVEGAQNVGRVVGYNGYGTISNGYYNTDMKCEKCGDGALPGVSGKTTVELATLDVATAFMGSTVWKAYEGFQPVGYIKGVAYLLPTLKNGTMPWIKYMGYLPNAEGVYEISEAQHLKWFAQMVNNGNFQINGVLMKDICMNACKEGDKPLLEQIASLGPEGDLSKLGFEEWTPIGMEYSSYYGTYSYTGTFDGKGHTVRGLFFNGDEEDDDYVGLFGQVGYRRYNEEIRENEDIGGIVQNVGVVDSYIFVGTLGEAGGVIGYLYSGTVKNVYNTGAVSGGWGSYVGGVVGNNNRYGSVSGAYNTGAVSGGSSSYVGGVVGNNNGYGSVSGAYNTGAVSGGSGSDVGGVVGSGSVSDAYNTGTVSGGSSSYVGGVAGSGSVSDAYNTGTVSGGSSSYVGGVAGRSSTVKNAYNTGDVNGEGFNRVGGVVGYVYESVSDGYYNTDMICKNCGGAVGIFKGSDSSHVFGMTTAELAALDVAKAFPNETPNEKSPWLAGVATPRFTNGVYVFTLPGFENAQPEVSPLQQQDGVYEIKTGAQLAMFAEIVNTVNPAANAKLMNDIVVNVNVLQEGSLNGDCSGFTQWKPIGLSSNPFVGTFDGDGHSIRGLFLNDDGMDFAGLFGKVGAKGVVKNVSVENSYIKGRNHVGALVGENEGTFSDVYATGAVLGNSCVGGIAGNNAGSVKNVYSTAFVDGASKENVGSVIGKNESGTVRNGYYNTDMICKNCVNVDGITGMNFLQLSSLNVAEAFPKSDAWVDGDKQTVRRGSSLYIHLPRLKNSSAYPEAIAFTPKEGVYEIAYGEQLKWFAQFVNGGDTTINGVLTADICLNACNPGDKPLLMQVYSADNSTYDFDEWTPIGTVSNRYVGTFDGKGHTVRGLYFNKDWYSVGLFGRIGKGTVQNVGVIDSYIKGKSYVGGVVGYCMNGQISNVYNAGHVEGSDPYDGTTGGIAGDSYCSISNAFNIGEVVGIGSDIGGIVGRNNGSVSFVYNAGFVKGYTTSSGGVVGTNQNSVSYSYSNVDSFSGDVVGWKRGGTIASASKMTTEELASLDVAEAFSGSDAWESYAGEQPVVTDGKAVYKLPKLKVFSTYPEIEIGGAFEISNADQLMEFARQVNDGNVRLNAKLMGNIELNMDVLKEGVLNVLDTSKFVKWTPIQNYNGTFDGGGFTISGLYFNDETQDNVGLFGLIGSVGIVENLGLANSYVAGKDNVGIIAGHNEGGTVKNVYSSGFVKGYGNNVGGAVGYCRRCTINEVYSVTTVDGNGDQVGGVVGENCEFVWQSVVKNVYHIGDVKGRSNVGGVLGRNNKGRVENIFSSSEVTGESNVGGIVGYNVYGSSIVNIYCNTDFFSGSQTGKNEQAGYAQFSGVVTTQLVSLDVQEVFPGSDAWITYEGEQPVERDGKLYYKFPALKLFGIFPEVEINEKMEFGIGSAKLLDIFTRYVNRGYTKLNAKLLTNLVVNNNVLSDKQGVPKVDENGNYIGTAPAKVWTPIGTEGNPYLGTFDGNGHTISGLYFNEENVKNGMDVGFFGYVGTQDGVKGTVKNVGIVDSYIRGLLNVGGVVGTNKGSVSGVYNKGYVVGAERSDYMGGVVGYNEGDVSNAYNSGYVSGELYIGGIVGGNYNGGSVSDVYNTGYVGGTRSGGVVGVNEGQVSHVLNFGTMNCSNSSVGGVVGYNNEKGVVTNGYYNTDLFCMDELGDSPIALAKGAESNVSGKTTAELAALDVAKAFEGSSAWMAYSGDKFFQKDRKWTYKLPGLRIFNINPEVAPVIKISTADELKSFAERVNKGNSKINGQLTADICLNACKSGDKPLLEQVGKSGLAAWTPIGKVGAAFEGYFDGAGHTIRGLYFNNDEKDTVGLFGLIETTGTVKNVGLVDSYIKGRNCIGGIVGFNHGGTISDVYNAGTLIGSEKFVAGIVGENTGGFIRDVYNVGYVKGASWYVGGIVGYNWKGGTIDNAYNSADVSGDGFVGGVVGVVVDGASVSNVYYNTDMLCEHCGGVVGSGTQSNVPGDKTTAELAMLDIAKAFSGSDSWDAYEGEQPVLNDGKMIYKLPRLKVFKDSYPEMEFSVYQIGSAEQLYEFAKRVNKGDSRIQGVLTANITLNSNVLKDGKLNGSGFTQWTPIGTDENPFTGVFDGNGFIISGLYFSDDSKENVGLFGKIGNPGVVKNVGLIDSYVKGKNHVGGVAGQSANGAVSNVFFDGIAIGTENVGGIVGGAQDGSVIDAYSVGSVTGSIYVGGVIGGDVGVIVRNVYTSADVAGDGFVGGAVGIKLGGTVNYSYSNMDMLCVHCGGVVGSGDDVSSVNNIVSLSSAQLAALDVAEAFNSNVWESAPENDNPALNNGKMVYKLPRLKAFKDNYSYSHVKFDYYEIGDDEQLLEFAERVNKGDTKIYGKLTENIVLNSNVLKDGKLNEDNAGNFSQWTPIGTGENPYIGIFDGDGHVVSGLYFNDNSKDAVGLFGKIEKSGIVKNVGLIDSYVNGMNYVGGAVGHNLGGSVSNVFYDGAVMGTEIVGGVVGANEGGSVNDVYGMGSVIGSKQVGGVIGVNAAGTVDNVYASAVVSGEGFIGGAIGVSRDGSVSYCYSNKDLFCEHCGGVVGSVEGDEASVEKIARLTTAEFATLDVVEAFFGSGAWVNAPTKDNPLQSNGTLIYRLPGLKVFKEPYLYREVKFDYFEIGNAKQLLEFAERVNGGDTKLYGKLTENIVLNSNVLKDGKLNEADVGKFTSWTPIGTNENPFIGIFDGDGKTISGLYFKNSVKDAIGLFGKIEKSGIVRNVGVIDSYVHGQQYVGGVVGLIYDGGSVSNVYNAGLVNGYKGIGGIVGGNYGSSIDNAYNVGTVNGSLYVGGVVGYNTNGGAVSNVYSSADVYGGSKKIVGNVYGTFFSGGGIVGVIDNASISHSFFNKDLYCEYCINAETRDFDPVGYEEGPSSVTDVSGKTTVQLAKLDVASAFSNAEGIWKSGSVVNGENGTVVYKLPYLSKFKESNQPTFTGSLAVSVANSDVYFKSEVEGGDFKVSYVVNGKSSASEDGEYKFAKSTWGEDGIVKGTYNDLDFTVTAPSVVIASDKQKAKVFGYSKQPVKISNDVSVEGSVSFERTFAPMGKNQYSTIMLPFTAALPSDADISFYEFAGISDKSGRWQVSVRNVLGGTLSANTPYLIQVSGDKNIGSISFGAANFAKVEGGFKNASMGDGLPWNLVGAYEYKAWEEGDAGIGKTYGFGAKDGVNAESVVGQFKKVGAGAHIYPMRVYLEYVETSAPNGVRAANGSKASQGTLASLPENIEVVIVDAKDSSETTVIGTVNTRTGEFKATDRYFDAKGRNVGKKPAAKGSFYR